MIIIVLSNQIYENDVHPLIKAFYPRQELRIMDTVLYEEQKDELEQLKEITVVFLTTGQEQVLCRIKTFGSEQDKNRNQITADSMEQGQIDVSELQEKSRYKNAMKRLLYRMLSRRTGDSLPWGILTGIRPTKLVYEMLVCRKSDEEIYRYMSEEYLCSQEKIRISLQIAKKELDLLHEMDYKNGYSLYIGIPFCPTTCAYCSFTSYPLERFSGMVENYLKALEKEIIYGADCIIGKKLTTVYFGGGTPTSLTAEQLDRLLGLIREKYDFTYVKEFCVEAGRPDTITMDKLLVLKKWGVDRISINPQTMKQDTLDLIGRRHTVEQMEQAFRMAREAGHDNINTDIIIGLPGEGPEDVEETLTGIKRLNPESLTVHTLALKRAARLNTEKQNYRELQATEVTHMLHKTMVYAREEGYQPYYLYRQKNMADNLENIGYARPGREGLYNILIMEEQQTILALGAGAMSKFVFYKENRIERVDNVKSITDYINRIDEMIQRKKDFINKSGWNTGKLK